MSFCRILSTLCSQVVFHNLRIYLAYGKRAGQKVHRDNLRGQKSLGPLKMSLEMAHKVIVPQKKIMSRSFLNSGTLIVILWKKKHFWGHMSAFCNLWSQMRRKRLKKIPENVLNKCVLEFSYSSFSRFGLLIFSKSQYHCTLMLYG